MINLLPRREKRELYAGRTNALLVRYSVLTVVAIVMVLAALGIMYVYLTGVKQQSEQRIAASEQDGRELLAKQQEITAFQSDLATAKQILDKQINYSSVILRFSSALPPGVVMDQLQLDPATFGTPTPLNVKARSDQVVVDLKNRLNASEYFADAHIDSITHGDEAGYPVSATLTVTLKKEMLQ